MYRKSAPFLGVCVVAAILRVRCCTAKGSDGADLGTANVLRRRQPDTLDGISARPSGCAGFHERRLIAADVDEELRARGRPRASARRVAPDQRRAMRDGCGPLRRHDRSRGLHSSHTRQVVRPGRIGSATPLGSLQGVDRDHPAARPHPRPAWGDRHRNDQDRQVDAKRNVRVAPARRNPRHRQLHLRLTRALEHAEPES